MLSLLEKLFSFLKVLYQATSPVSGKVEVTQRGRERRLMVQGICQSVGMETPGIERRYWGRVVAEVRKRRDSLQNALILGLGGGTVAHLLRREFSQVEITGVELDPQIVDVAERFFGLGTSPNLNVVCTDALDAVSRPRTYGLAPGTYDLILSDLYCGGRFPEPFSRRDFLVGVKDLLAPQGLAKPA